jgi:hypothetical protein
MHRSARKANRFISLAGREVKSGVPLDRRERLRMIRGGFLSESYVIYQLDKNDRSQYLSDFQRWVRTPDVNGQYHLLLRDKLLFALVMKSFPLHDVDSFGVIRNGRVFYAGCSKIGAADYLLQLLQIHPRLVLKPIDAGGGANVRFLFRRDEGLLLNGTPLCESRLRTLVSSMRNDIISCFVEQSREVAALNPRTTNTLRVLTMWDLDIGEPFVVAAVLRIGRESSYPVDNWSKGGLSAEVDLESGRLGKGVGHPGRDLTLTWHSQHPESGAPIEGFAVPQWQDIKARLLGICRSVPFLQYVGWDLILTDSGFKILEGNHYADVNLLQVHRPLLADARVVRFYKAHGVI